MAKVFQSLKGRREIGLAYRKAARCRLEALADASNAEDKEDRRSVRGVATLFRGAALS